MILSSINKSRKHWNVVKKITWKLQNGVLIKKRNPIPTYSKICIKVCKNYLLDNAENYKARRMKFEMADTFNYAKSVFLNSGRNVSVLNLILRVEFQFLSTAQKVRSCHSRVTIGVIIRDVPPQKSFRNNRISEQTWLKYSSREFCKSQN